MRVKRIHVLSIASHRNGLGGAPFHAIIFDEDQDARYDEQGRKLAIVFEGAYHCAVFDLGKLVAGDIAFGSNSWRGDEYEPLLRKAIIKHNSEA
jgi:hypothetical protein